MFYNLDNNTIIMILFSIFLLILLYKECTYENFSNEDSNDNDIEKLRNITDNISASDSGIIISNDTVYQKMLI